MKGPLPGGESSDRASTIGLVHRAKAGHRDAWSELLKRYYDLWLERYHGRLGTTVRRLYDTQALVHSAIADALRDISRLEDESVFFAWVTSILRHKLALRHRQNCRDRPLEVSYEGAEPSSPEEASPARQAELADTYIRTLEAILSGFNEQPSWMAALVLRHLDGLEVSEIAPRLGVPERTAFHWVASGKAFLKERLPSEVSGEL